MRAAIALTAFTFLLSPALAQDSTPNGMWQDSFGTILDLSLCGDGTQLCGDGTQLCGVLVDVQGESRTEDNLAFVGQEIMQAEQTAANEWKGAVMFDGSEAASTITQVAANTIEIQGCRVVILCQTLSFQRVEPAADPA